MRQGDATCEDARASDSTVMTFSWEFLLVCWPFWGRDEYPQGQGHTVTLPLSCYRGPAILKLILGYLDCSTVSLHNFQHIEAVATIVQTFWNAFSGMITFQFQIKCYWNMFLRGQVDNILALVQIMAWHQTNHYLIPISLTHICITLPQWFGCPVLNEMVAILQIVRLLYVHWYNPSQSEWTLAKWFILKYVFQIHICDWYKEAFYRLTILTCVPQEYWGWFNTGLHNSARLKQNGHHVANI